MKKNTDKSKINTAGPSPSRLDSRLISRFWTPLIRILLKSILGGPFFGVFIPFLDPFDTYATS